MSKQRKTFASTYLYDPLDRLASANTTQRFYNQSRIATEIEGERKSRFFEFDSQPLALQQHGAIPGTTLLATDQQTSVLSGVSPEGALQAQAYSPFGYHPIDASLNAVGFNGERPEPVTGHYLLGQGYRAFNPVLMRFNSPDSWSPFGEGGMNAYTYCDNDPVNEIDPEGHAGFFSALRSLRKGIGNRLGLRQKKFKNLETSHNAPTASTHYPPEIGTDGLPLSPPSYESLNIKKSNLIKPNSPPPKYINSKSTYSEGLDINRIITRLEPTPDYWSSFNLDHKYLPSERLHVRKQELNTHLGLALRQAIGSSPIPVRPAPTLNIPVEGARLGPQQLQQNRMMLARAVKNIRN